MGQRLAWGLFALLAIVILAGHLAGRPEAPAHAPARAALPAPLPPPRHLSLEPNPNATAPERGTPQIDLLAILAIRRRIEREGRRIYLDSLLAATDSTVVRWPDRPTHAYYVVFLPDTALAGWTPDAQAAAEEGLRRWSGNSAGIVLSPITDTSVADITVHWSALPPRPNEIGATDVSWGSDGVITHASIALALAFDSAHAVDHDQRVRAAAHEFGHALGLPHSALSEDLMYPRAEQGAPSRRDDATLLLLYTVPPGRIKTPSP